MSRCPASEDLEMLTQPLTKSGRSNPWKICPKHLILVLLSQRFLLKVATLVIRIFLEELVKLFIEEVHFAVHRYVVKWPAQDVTAKVRRLGLKVVVARCVFSDASHCWEIAILGVIEYRERTKVVAMGGCAGRCLVGVGGRVIKWLCRYIELGAAVLDSLLLRWKMSQ